MRSNLEKVFENEAELDAMEDRSGTIRSTAEAFQVSSTRLEKIARQRRYRAYMILFAMVSSFLFLMYLILRKWLGEFVQS